MSNELILSITQHGYYAIFVLIFLQEVGVPNPIPNELVLLFSGYLAFLGVLNFPLIILSAVIGDLLGSGILFTAFYFFGSLILTRKPRWIPISEKKIQNLSARIERTGRTGVLIGRLSPFIRGYVSVLCGLLRISPQRYSLILLLSATIWALGYAGVGFLVGPYWNVLVQSKSDFQLLLGLIPVVALCVFIVSVSARKIFLRTN